MLFYKGNRDNAPTMHGYLISFSGSDRCQTLRDLPPILKLGISMDVSKSNLLGRDS